MNLYSRKQRWKIILFLVAVCIAASSLVYTNYITQKIKEDERLRIKIWSSAVRIQIKQLYLTNKLFDKVKTEEEKKIKLWARGMQELGKDLPDYTFALEVISDNKTVPAILTDEKGNFTTAINLDFTEQSIGDQVKKTYTDKSKEFLRLKAREIFTDTITKLRELWMKTHKPIAIGFRGKTVNYVFYKESKLLDELKQRKDSITTRFNQELRNNAALVPVIFIKQNKTEVIETNIPRKELQKNLAQRLNDMEAQNKPIHVKLTDKDVGLIYYEDSKVLAQIKLFPLIQTAIVGIFLLITYLIFNTFKNAEQNQVWAGMAKETAHQLGTPLSSLMAWNEILKGNGTDSSITMEIDKDIERLNTITDRFSKIGSDPKLEKINLTELIDKFISYLKPRVSKNIHINCDEVPLNIFIKGNGPLLEWVFENLSKNAIDAMEASGELRFMITKDDTKIYIDISDTGKGIPTNKFKTVFKPGYSTKQRGWGLGLSLVKRIVEEYHDGKIYVAGSEIGKGTTFRVVLNKV